MTSFFSAPTQIVVGAFLNLLACALCTQGTFAQSAPLSVQSPPPTPGLVSPRAAIAHKPEALQLALDPITELLRARQFEMAREEVQEQDLALQKELFEKGYDAKFTLKDQIGARLQPKEKGAALEDANRVALVPRDFALTQAHSLVASRTLYDFGRKEAGRRALAAQEKLLPFSRLTAQTQARWEAARLLLALRNTVGVVRSLEAQLENAQRKRQMIEGAFDEGLRSLTDRTRAEADVLRVELQREQARQAVREAATALASRLGDVRSSAIEDAALSEARPSIRERSVGEWRGLFEASGVFAQAGSVAFLPPLAAIELALLDAKRGMLRERMESIEKQEAPTLAGEVGTQWPGELFPLRGQIYGQLTFAWEIPWNGKGAIEKERVASEMRLLELEERALRQTAEESVRAAWPARDALLRELDILMRQRVTLERLRGQTGQRYASGRASTLEVSQLEDELLSNSTETARLQGRLATALLAFATAQGNEALARALVD